MNERCNEKLRKGDFLHIAISFCLGIAATYFSWWLLVLLLLYLFCFCRRQRRAVFLTISFFLFGCIYIFIIDANNVTKFAEDDGGLIVGEIISIIDIDGDKVSFTIKANDEKLVVQYFMSSKTETKQVKELFPGAKCVWSGQLKKPSHPTNLYAFNYNEYLYHQKIHWVYELNALPTLCKESITTFTKLQQVRQTGMTLVQEEIPSPASSFIIALLFGERKFIEENTIIAYQKLGIVHLLAISGLHVGVLTGFLFYICVRIGITRERALQLLLLFLPFYVIIAGAAPSVIRASCMTGFVLIFMLQKKRLLAIDAIGLACFVLLMINPYYLFHVGFQLSFSVSLALLLSTKIIQTAKNSFARVLLVSSIAQLASFPIIIYHFYEISLWSFLLNTIYVPFYSLFILPLSFIIFIVCIFGSGYLPTIFPFMQWPLTVMNDLAIYLADVPFGHLSFGKPHRLMVGIFYAVIIALFYYIESGNRKRIIIIFSLLCVLCFGQLNSGYFTSYGKVIVIDIGQGTAIVVKLPYGQGTFLIDTGGETPFEKEEWRTRRNEFHSGQQILLPLLKAEGIRTLDKLIITHGHYDHFGNAEVLWESLQVKETVVPFTFGRDELEEQFIKEAMRQNVPIRYVRSGDSWKAGHYVFRILMPDVMYENKNNDSIVILTELGDLTWLFTGDMEKEAEEKLLNQYPSLHADVLLVAHHGSSTSTTEPFLQVVNPKVGIISVGRNNRYGHPDVEVLKRLHDEKVRVFRTDENGAISYKFTIRSGTFSTVLP